MAKKTGRPRRTTPKPKPIYCDVTPNQRKVILEYIDPEDRGDILLREALTRRRRRCGECEFSMDGVDLVGNTSSRWDCQVAMSVGYDFITEPQPMTAQKCKYFVARDTFEQIKMLRDADKTE